MRSLAPTAILLALIGATVGSAASVPWLAATASSGSGALSLVTTAGGPVLATLALALLSLVVAMRRRLTDTSVAALIALPTTLVLYAAVHTVAVAVLATLPALVLLLPGLAALALGLALRKTWITASSVPLCIAAAPQVHSVSVLTGAALASRALDYGPLPPAIYFLHLALPLALLGLTAGMFAAWLLGREPFTGMLRGAAAGLGVSAIAGSAQMVALLTCMATAGSPYPVWLSFTLVWSSLLCLSAAAAPDWVARRPFRLVRIAPLIAIVAIATYILVASYGAADYFSLTRCHADTSYTYIHFTGPTSWQRTLSPHGSSASLARCRHFLDAYPNSAYYPAVLLRLAECQFELWDFPAAQHTLDALVRRYPHFQGSPSVLRAMFSLPQGDGSPILASVPPDSDLAGWRRTSGALLAAQAADRRGLPYRALGLYAAYADYLQHERSASWVPASAAYADARSDELMHRLRSGQNAPRHGSLSVRVLADDRPVRDARVILVRPHPDAALPSDSQQFTGAWTMAAWDGIWGQTDFDGRVTLRRIPYGTYNVVLGLSQSTARSGYVIRSAVPPVTVDSRTCSLPDIRLVRAVRLTAPRRNAHTSTSPRLAWQAYPGAYHYSVSVIAQDLPASSREPSHILAGHTCWTRSRIRALSVSVDPDHFLNGHHGLRPGGTYAWIVYAYDGLGNLLSSSEHYADLSEPTFTVARANSGSPARPQHAVSP